MKGLIELSEYEKKFIRLYGDLFSIRDRSKNFGKIFSLLILKSSDENHGLTQDEIGECLEENDLVNRISQSTVSRTLTQLQHNHYCEFVCNNVREKRKYYTKKNFLDLSSDLIQRSITDGKRVITLMEGLANEIPEEAKSQVEIQNLLVKINEITEYFDFLTQVYLDLLEKNRKRIESK